MILQLDTRLINQSPVTLLSESQFIASPKLDCWFSRKAHTANGAFR